MAESDARTETEASSHETGETHSAVRKPFPQSGPSTLIACLLAGAGGYLDAFTYLGHGHVFANAMTGNVVLLGVNCISGDWRTGLRHLPAIVSFLIGVAVAAVLRLKAVERRIRFRSYIVLAVEMIILAALSLLPKATPDLWFTTTIAFAASVQVATFRNVHGQSYNSTFTTGNLRTLSEGIVTSFSSQREPQTATLVRDFALICGSFLAGATAGGLLTPRLGNHALWIDIALLLIVFVRIASSGFSSSGI